MKYLSIVIFLFANYCLAANASPAAEAFNKLKTTVGKWKNEGRDGKDFYIQFETTANNTVLVENWMYKGASHSLTLYHLDGDTLLATHYCPQGNQPRLMLTEYSNPESMAFTFKDATNLPNPNQSHQHTLGFEFVNNNSLKRAESYTKNGIFEPSEMHLVRIDEKT